MAEKSFLLEDRQGAMIDKLSDEDAGKLLKAIFHYRESGEVDDLPFGADIVFIPIQQTIDENEEKYREVCERRAEAGRQGGRPRKANASEEKQKKQMVSEESKKSKRFSEKAKKADSDTDSDTDTDIKEKVSPIGDTKKKSPAPKKNVYGEFQNVMLSADDLDRLKAKFPEDLDSRIEKLSAYIASTGKKYKDHRATIMNWARRDEEQGKGRDRPKRSYHRPDDDIYSDDIYEVL